MLCDECYDFVIDDRPACVGCGYEASTRSQRRLSLAISFLGLGLGLSYWLWRNRYTHEELGGLIWLLAASVVVGSGLIFAFWDRGSPAAARRDREVEVPAELAEVGPSHPYRARLRRAAARLAPRVSGAATAGIVGAALALSAVALPAMFDLPRWVEIEIVLAVWWLLSSALLGFLLYRGFRLKDDFVFVPFWRRSRAPAGGGGASGGSGSSSSWLDSCGCDGCSGVDGEGVLVALALAVVLAVLLGAAWVVAEIALPVLLFSAYAVIHRAITRVAHDTHACEGNVGRAIGWGIAWATIYVVPLSAVVWGVHVATR